MDWLEAKLRNIGKESFEEDYDIYEAYGTGRCSRADAVDALVRRGRSENENGAGWRLGAAKAIFKAGIQDEALRRARNRRR
jgi:hypothetical protein